MTRSRKRIRMIVEVSCPVWLTAAQARKEVRSLINYGAHAGSRKSATDYEGIDGYNFRAAKVSANG